MNSPINILVDAFEDWDLVAKEIFNLLPQGVYLFKGELGAGKTTCIQQSIKKLGVTEEVNSPTFSLIHQYQSSDQKKIIHADLYRLNNSEELGNIGWFEVLEASDYAFIEWPEISMPWIDTPFLEIEIKREAGSRFRNVYLSLISHK